jgi:hypothetical protein
MQINRRACRSGGQSVGRSLRPAGLLHAYKVGVAPTYKNKYQSDCAITSSGFVYNYL